MTLRDLLLKTRSYRRFYEEKKISIEELKEMVDNVRLAPSAANKQPLKFILVTDENMNQKIFPYLRWAGYLPEWDGPGVGERPTAYIIMMGNRKESPNIDADYGIAMQTIMLSAVEKGYGGCLIGSFDKDKVRELLNIPSELETPVIFALGKPKEEVVIDEVKEGNIKYWRDEQQVHHVPKRKLEDLIFKLIPQSH
ncbi:MAG TPA: nitroreductase family protein [Candidatus Deferrimicrobium sp.]|nr:nitroreductase family protein [Candidatus Deferrimicrobium sp.]